MNHSRKIVTPSQGSDITLFTNIFEPISLVELNEKADMLERIDNKYILNAEELSKCGNALKESFDILEINGLRSFTYETTYFDTPEHLCYFEHQREKRLIFKVRTRSYIDSGETYLELKLEDRRERTIKKRLKYIPENSKQLTDEAYAFIQKHYKNYYKKDFLYSLIPSLTMTYKRITLVAKEWGERLTIDFALHFSSFIWNGQYHAPSDFIIIEAKSSHGHGIADKIFRSEKHRSTGCSKFCLSKILTGDVKKANRFLPILRKHFAHSLPSYLRSQYHKVS